MSTTESEVAQVEDNAGTEVWCPNGHGNRILDAGEKIGFGCPVCSAPMKTTMPEPTGKKVEVRLPEVGRVVHVTLGPNTVRPAIVMGRNEDGRCLLSICRHEDDPGIAGLAGNTAVVSPGEGIGTWQWPPKSEPQFFDLYVED